VQTYPLSSLNEGNAHVTARFSDRSKFGNARIWLPDIDVFDPVGRQGWSVVVRLHGGNGNNQGDIDPDVSTLLLMMLNELGSVVVSINWQDNGFYEPLAQDPRALFAHDGLLEPSMIVPWLIEHFDDAALFGKKGFITRDPGRIALFGVSDGAWRAALLAYSPTLDVPANVLIASQAHFDAEHFWMTEPSDAIQGWVVVTEALLGTFQLRVAGGSGAWLVGHELVLEIAGHSNFRYLVTDVAGDKLTVWPSLRVNVAPQTGITPFDNAVSKYSLNGYSWFGAPLFRAGAGVTWANYPSHAKRAVSLWPLISGDNPRVQAVRAILLYPASEPYITNDADPVSGWRALITGSGPNPRYKDLHAECNGFALAGLLADLGYTQGTQPNHQFLLRAGGSRTNPDLATRYSNLGGEVIADVKSFLVNHGW
jgi:hypothetical protein